MKPKQNSCSAKRNTIKQAKRVMTFVHLLNIQSNYAYIYVN